MIDPLSLDKRQVKRSFERAAASYDKAAVLQREVRTHMLQRLDYIKYFPKILLDAGSGTGAAARELLERYPDSIVVELDIAVAMLKTSRASMPWWRRYLFPRRHQVCGDIEKMPLKTASVDMIWSNLALQWCNDLSAAFTELHRILVDDGLLVFTTFGPDTLKELRVAAGVLDPSPHVHRFTDIHEIGDALLRSGFTGPVVDVECFTLTYEALIDIVRDLRAIGARNAAQARARGLRTNSAWSRLREAYESLRVGGKLPASYEVIYGHAWRSACPTVPIAGARRMIKIHPLP